MWYCILQNLLREHVTLSAVAPQKTKQTKKEEIKVKANKDNLRGVGYVYYVDCGASITGICMW